MTEKMVCGKIEEFLISNKNEFFRDFLPVKNIYLMKIKSRPGSYSSVAFYLFADTRAKPDFLIKVNRAPGYFEAVENEYKNLKYVYEKTKTCELNIPKPVFCEKTGQNIVFCETFVGGKPQKQVLSGLNARVGLWSKIDDYLTRSVKWLLEFQKAVMVKNVTLNEEWINEKVSRKIRAFTEKHKELDENTKRVLISLKEHILEHKGVKLPVSAGQGDFDQWNILVEKDIINVVDWEDLNLEASVYDDFYTLVFHLALLHNSKSKEEENFNNFFADSSEGYKAFLKALGVFSKNYDLPEKLFYLLAPLYVMEVIEKKYPPHRDPASIPLNDFDKLRLITRLAKRGMEK